MLPGERQPENTSIIAGENNISPDNFPKLKDSGEISKRNLFGIICGGAALVGTLYFANRILEEIHVPKVDISLGEIGAKPPVIEAAIDPLTYEVEGTFEMIANSRVGVAVSVEGHKDGALWGFFGLTDATYSKKIFGDFLLATDNAKINSSLVVEKQGDKILGVSATLDALDVFQPRVDFADYRNQIDLNAKDSSEQIDKKIKEYLADGSHQDPTGGFDCGMCTNDSVELVNGAYFLTQFALTVDARQPDIIADATERYRRNMIQQLSVQYGISPALVNVDIKYPTGTDPSRPPTPAEVSKIYKDRIQNAYDESFTTAGDSVFDIKPELRKKDDGSEFVYTKMHGGAELTIDLSGINYSPEIRDLILQNIKENSTEVASNTDKTNDTKDTIVTKITVPMHGPLNPDYTTTTNIWQVQTYQTGG